jgi:ABC-2 type transport system permease protein
MNTPSTAMPQSSPDSGTTAPAAATMATRPLYWSVRRELWESRSIYIAPLLVAGIALVGFVISAIGLPARRRALLMLDPERARAAVEVPYDVAAMVLILTSFLVGAFYCLDALHGERRDRSILFWKSMPVSDLTTVLSKVAVPLVILPSITICLIAATQVAMMLVTDAMLLASGQSASTWTLYPLFHHLSILLYGLIVLALWHAPIYGWLLLVSVWARRVTFLWAVLPLFAVSILERIGFGTAHFASLLKYRFIGGIGEAFAVRPHDVNAVMGMPEPEPLKFLASPGLWIGLVVAVLFLAAAIRLRRSREPI